MACGKKSYPTERAAISIALRASKRSGTALRVYRCARCRAFHLTKKKQWLDTLPYEDRPDASSAGEASERSRG